MDIYSDPFFSKRRSIDELAEYLTATRPFLWDQIAKGKLRAVRLTPKFIRVMPDDLREWLERSATRPKELTTQKEAAV
jgi:excisionase family DNA binding protein